MTHESDWASAFSKLSACCARIRFYCGQGYYIHAKLLLVHAGEALVGSQNLSTTSLDYTRELSIELTSAPMLGRLAAAFDRDYSGGTP